MNTNIPAPVLLNSSKNLSFVEWLKKKPDNSRWNHFEITKEWAVNLIDLIDKEEKLYVKTPPEVFIQKFQYFLYKRSSKNKEKYKLYFK